MWWLTTNGAHDRTQNSDSELSRRSATTLTNRKFSPGYKRVDRLAPPTAGVLRVSYGLILETKVDIRTEVDHLFEQFVDFGLTRDLQASSRLGSLYPPARLKVRFREGIDDALNLD